jgi:spore germination protein
VEKISGRQLVLIGVAYTTNATLISVPNQIIEVARTDAWLSYVSAMIVIAASIWLVSKVSARFPDKDLFEIMVDGLPYIGRMLALSYVLFFFIILARDIRMLTDFVNITLLPFTPLVVVSVLIVVTAFLVARGGIETLARMTEIWLPVLLIIFILILFPLFREFEFRYLKPFFEFGAVPALKGGWYAVAYLGEVIALPLIFANKTFTFNLGFKALLIGTISLLLLNFYTILSLGIHIPPRVLYPTYEMIRQIKITDFLDRFDLPLVGVYLPTMLTKVGFSLFVVCHGIKRVFPSVSAKLLTMPFAAFGFVCSFWFFSNAIQLLRLNRTWPAFALIFELLIPILLYIVVKNRKSATI